VSIHKAIVSRIIVTPHPDKEVHSLAVGTVCNETVICGINIQSGTLGLYFPCELQLSKEFAEANDLIRRKDASGKPAGGMFDINRRVRLQTFRGVKSHGFWISVASLEKLGGDVSTLKEGDTLDIWNNISICNKYFSARNPPKTSSKKALRKSEKFVYLFPEHKDTEQFKYNLKSFKAGDEIIITNKMEGTSQRVAKNYQFRPLKWWEKIVSKWVKVDNRELVILNGTRRVVLNNKKNDKSYHPQDLRDKAIAKIFPYLDDHMHVYFEVVGFEGPNQPIMPRQSLAKVKEKEYKKLYPETITYSYGHADGDFGVYVYRISYVLPSGKELDLTWDEVKDWCILHSIPHVLELDRFVFDGDYDALLKRVDSFDGPDPIDKRHPMEGTCLRINGSRWRCFKNKSWLYKILAGIAKEDENYSDCEEEQNIDN